MAMVDAVYMLPMSRLMVQACWLGPKVSRWLHSSRELLQWLCHDDSTMDIVVGIIITMIIILYTMHVVVID